ncbi:hypothetical protein Vadar_001274 [Vaccinium darrowii]|uniref:Uncharacterized protein n=1 Tax=Vaccinium darrowii TaxID=229202 RepID=A0ACB7WWW5_9ERIC|nr:hypothetical protein Vadar_001274 [Vaccinium darrowii]
MELDDKLLNVALLILGTLAVAKLISTFLNPRSNKRLPPTVAAWPVFGGLVRFLKGPVVMLREEYPEARECVHVEPFEQEDHVFHRDRRSRPISSRRLNRI